jgi:hypothetical protein
MAQTVEPGSDDDFDDETWAWMDDVQPHLVNLEDFQLPDDFPFDLSVASLDPLEAFLLERLAGTVDGDDPLALGVVAYLGEAFMRIAGGRWAGSGIAALVQLDPALGLPAMSPTALIDLACERRTGHEFAAAAARIEQAVAARQAEVPGWEPTKVRTLSVDDID